VERETSLQVSAAVLAAIIDHVAHPIFVKDRHFRFVLVNRALCDMVGYERKQMIGKTDYDFFPQPEADFFRQKDVEMFTTQSSVTIDEEPITDVQGNVHILATTKVPHRNAAGEVTHVVGIIHDITRIKQAEETLRTAKDELERRVAERTAELEAAQQQLLRQERLSVLGQLAGGLAHQLRNPLGTIQNASALLRRGELSSSKQQALDIIEEEVHRADLIIRDLLDYVRIRPPARREVTLAHVVYEAIHLARVPADVAVDVDLGEEHSALLDPLQIQTALGNILRNAAEAMPNGGEVRIQTATDDASLTITVTDSGPGVADEVQERLFDPLVTTKPTGSGLGLSTARDLIENHGGTIQYAPAPGGGARFTIVLPNGSEDETTG
jgi:PAS domain S-box-containing protein